MIRGSVNAREEAIVVVAVSGANDTAREIQTIVDTGFSGALTLPRALITDLGLPWQFQTRVLLANGAEEECDVYAATIVWDGVARRISVEAAETEPLLGMRLLSGHDVRIRVVPGGAVIIEAIS